MKEISSQERSICSFQAKVFEASASYSKSSSAVFIRRFMLSDYARRLDQAAALLDTDPIQQVITKVEKEYRSKEYGSKKYQAMELHWMGYLYRYWCIAFGLTSKEVYKIIGARALHELYYPYHSLNVEQAIIRICESQHISFVHDVSYGTQLLKRIRNERKERRGVRRSSV